MRKLLLALPLALLLVTAAACGTNSPLAPESSALQPASEECSDIMRPC